MTLSPASGSPTSEVIDLSNGVRIVFDSMPNLASTALGLWINRGARHETASQMGVAHLLEHMVFKGAQGRDAAQFSEAIENIGASMNAGTGYERTSYYARCLAEHAPETLDLIAGAVLAPDLAPEELTRERQVVIQEIGEAFDDASDHVFTLAQEAVFGEHPLGRPILGTPESLNALQVSDLREFMARAHHPKEVIIGVAGAFDRNRMLDLIDENLRHLSANMDANPSDPAESWAQPPRLRAENRMAARSHSEQLHLVWTGQAPAQGDPAAFAARLFAEIYGGGMASRLFQEIREKRGLAYAIDAYYESYADVGRVGVYAGCAPKDGIELGRIAGDILLDLAQNGPTPGEMSRARIILKTQILMGAESPMARLEMATSQLFVYGKLLSLGDIAAALDAVQARDVQAIAANAARGPISGAAIGPKSGLSAIGAFSRRLAD